MESIIKALVEDIIFEKKDIDLIRYFEEIVGYEKQYDDFTSLIAKYIK